MARKPKTGALAKPPSPPIAYIVSGEGTDEEIAARCADAIPDWATLGERVQQDMIRLMRSFWEHRAPPVMTVSTNDDGGRQLSPPEGANVTLHTLRSIETFASPSEAFVNERLYDLSRHFSHGDASSKVSAGLAFVTGANAEDTVQSSLAVQMVATHDAAMQALRRSMSAEYLEHAQVYGSLATKLLNAYTRQAEVLAKLQRGGEQIIKHVHIDNRGGQAVVTDQLVTGGQNAETGHQPHAGVAALLGQDTGGYGMPIASDVGQEAVPDARWGVAGRA